MEAREIKKVCSGADVNSVSVSFQIVKRALSDDMPARIDVMPSQRSPAPAHNAVTVVAFGPVLGAMDSSKLRTELACTDKGFVLTATIMRSADYRDAVLANVNWRPIITVAVVVRRPETICQVTWRMRLTTGAELDRAQTPSSPEQKYPITVLKLIR